MKSFGADQAPGKSRMRLEITLSMTSEVPPSIELALVRSQFLAGLPPPVSSLSHSRLREPPTAIINSWRRLFSSVPTYFIMLGCARVRLADLDLVKEFLAHGSIGQRIDIEHGEFGAQHRINLVAELGRMKLSSSRRTRRSCPPPPAPEIILALVAEQVLGHVPAAIDLCRHRPGNPRHRNLGHAHIVEEGFAERANFR